MIVTYTVLEAIAFAIISQRRDSIMGFYVDIMECSRIYALFNAGMIALSAPFGAIIGELFEIKSSYPFYLNIILFIIAGLMVMKSTTVANYDEETSKLGNN